VLRVSNLNKVDQHPIPQHVTGYQFRLVGDMTLKQFSELAGGIILAFLMTKAAAIPFFVRWPLAGLFTFLGIALAFLPFEERPLDQWLINFVKAIYAPTQYLWRKKNPLPGFFKVETKKTIKTKPLPIKPKDKKKLQAFIKTLPSEKKPSPFEEYEKRAVEYVNTLFGPTPSAAVPVSSYHQPAAGLAPRKLKPKLTITQEELKSKKKLAEKVIEVKKPPSKKQEESPTEPPVEPKKPTVTVEPAQPLAPAFKVTSLYEPKPPKKPGPKKRKTGPQFASDLPMPVTPESPNLLTGMVVGPDDRLISNAIIEIRDLEENPVRALKTNKLGQFFIATPLLDGFYEIETEHPSYQFDIIKIKTDGQIIPPMKIKAVREIKPKIKDQKQKTQTKKLENGYMENGK